MIHILSLSIEMCSHIDVLEVVICYSVKRSNAKIENNVYKTSITFTDFFLKQLKSIWKQQLMSELFHWTFFSSFPHVFSVFDLLLLLLFHNDVVFINAFMSISEQFLTVFCNVFCWEMRDIHVSIFTATN